MLLAIETSGRAAGLALVSPDGAMAEREIGPQQSTAAALAPEIDALLTELGLRPADLRAIAVTLGPGSFTGLRVGVTTAKTLAYATGAAVIGVDTLHAVAEQSEAAIADVWVLLDAQRKQVYAACWQRDSAAEWRRAAPTAILDLDSLTEALPARAWVTGPGCALLDERARAALQLAPRETWSPRAATIARIGLRRWSADDVDDVWRLAPTYIRRAAAEEKADAKPRPK